jgi:glycogen debranching enzyme
VTSPPFPANDARARLWTIAADALTSNRVQLGERTLLTAGGNQFGSMWTRDFAYAARGLLALGDATTVRDHLDTILENTGEDQIVPRVVDTISIARRVVFGMLRGRLGMRARRPSRKVSGKLHAQIYDEHGSPSLDSNFLVIATAFRYAEASGDAAWLDARRPRLRALYDALRRYRDDSDGLIVQPKYSDWQDSVRREGRTFYINLLHAHVAGQLGVATDALDATVRGAFFDTATGLFRSLVGHELVSLDGNLLAIDLGFVRNDEARALYARLKHSELWSRGGLPGSNTVGDYPRGWAHWPARLAGLTHYHDRLHWSWLTGLSGKIAHAMGDEPEARRIFDGLAAMAERDGTIAEIYRERHGALVPFRSLLYRSEAPFSWGAGMILDALGAAA